MMSRPLAILLALVAFGCDRASESDSASSPSTTNATTGTTEEETSAAADVTNATASDVGAGGGCVRTRSAVSFETSDGVMLEADYISASERDSGAVVLLHMIPPSNDRTNYPDRVLEALADTGRHVVNVDRRGANQSGGDPADAYEGELGRLDVEAAVAFLLSPERGCPASPGDIVLVGASNGTTSALDYTLGRTVVALPSPRGLVWLSPGTYTENQFALADHRATLDSLSMLWVYPDSEPYSQDFTDGAPDTWQFLEVAGGAHGTRNFDEGALEEQVLSALLAFLTSVETL